MFGGRAPLAGLLAAASLAFPASALATHAEPLRGQWHLDSDTTDSSGHNLHASASPVPNFGPGKFGNAYDPTDFSEIRVADSSLLEPPQVTALAWVKNFDPLTFEHVLSKGADGCTGGSYAFYVANTSDDLVFYIHDALGLKSAPAAPGSTLWDGQWHMVAGTFDGATVRMYVDGLQVGSGTPVPGSSISYGFADDTLTIGSYPNQTCQNDHWWRGAIDEPRVYSRALSATEIGRLAAATGPTPPALVPDEQAGGGGGGGGGGAGGAAPTAAFRFGGKSPTMKRALRFDAGQSRAAEGLAISKYSWDFNGDGKFEVDCTGNATMVSHTVRRAGNYTATLQVTGSNGVTASTSQPFSVARNQINRSVMKVSACEAPLGENQPDRPGCVKTFAFGIVEVNGRGGDDQCFKLDGRPKEYLQSISIPGASSHDPIARPRSDFFFYNAKISGPVAINGLPVPVPKGVQTEYDSGMRTIGIGKVPILIPVPGDKVMKVTDIPLAFEVVPKKGRFSLPPLKAATKIPFTGMKIGGGVEISLLQGRKSEIKLSVILPDIFSFGFRRPAEGHVIFQASNQGGFEFEGIRIAKIPHTFIGPLLVNDLFFDYKRSENSWRGGANFQLLPISPVQIKAAPPPPDYGFGIKDGKFQYGGGGIAFPFPPRPQLFPGVGLVEVGGAFGVNPIRFTGRLAIDVGGVFVIDGSAFIALASQDEPYDFPEEFAPPGLEFLAGRHLDTLSIAGGGVAKIKVPVVGELPLINSYIFYAYPAYAELGGGFEFGIADRFSVKGNMGGFIALLQQKFNLEGQVQACADLEITEFCLGVGAVVSSKGIGFCTLVPLPVSPFGPTIPVPAGIGYTWGGGIDPQVFSCSTEPYKEARPSARGAQTGSSFTVEKGLPSIMVKVVGDGAPPKVELAGPKGERILAPQDDQSLVNNNVVVIPQTPEGTTLIAIKNPSAGRWTITPRGGSAPIRTVATANGLPDPSVKARVRGRGQRRVLTYRVKPAAGQRVTFFERGARTYKQIGVARGRRGRIRFDSADGRRGRREIVAQVERDGIVAKNLVVARYKAPATPRPARPRGVRARRKKNGLLVRWRSARGAFRYGVTVRLRNGSELFRLTRRRRVRFGDVGRLDRGRVVVQGLRVDGVGGRAARTRIPPPRKAKRRKR